MSVPKDRSMGGHFAQCVLGGAPRPELGVTLAGRTASLSALYPRAWYPARADRLRREQNRVWVESEDFRLRSVAMLSVSASHRTPPRWVPPPAADGT